VKKNPESRDPGIRDSGITIPSDDRHTVERLIRLATMVISHSQIWTRGLSSQRIKKTGKIWYRRKNRTDQADHHKHDGTHNKKRPAETFKHCFKRCSEQFSIQPYSRCS